MKVKFHKLKWILGTVKRFHKDWSTLSLFIEHLNIDVAHFLLWFCCQLLLSHAWGARDLINSNWTWILVFWYKKSKKTLEETEYSNQYGIIFNNIQHIFELNEV